MPTSIFVVLRTLLSQHYYPLSKYHKQKIGHYCNCLVWAQRLLLYQKLIDDNQSKIQIQKNRKPTILKKTIAFTNRTIQRS
jgi:hypothetical protein